MKTKKILLMGAIACGFAMSMTSCGSSDTPVYKQIETITFEGAVLNSDGYWCGNADGTPFENWGATGYACNYTEKGVVFPVNYTPDWGSWSGFAISSRTATTYAAATMTPDQYNSIAGGAKSGRKYCIVQTYGETLDFGKTVTLKGFWFTNTAWVVDAILHGDGMTPGKFEASDWFKCVIYPIPAEEGLASGARYEIDLAKDGDYVKDWQYCDLSRTDAFKNIKGLSFAFEGTKKNDYGVTTPTYICVDDITIEYNY